MVMRIVVFDPAEDHPATLTDWGALADFPPGPTDIFAIPGLVLTDDALDPSDIVDESDGEVAWADLSLSP